MKACDLQGWGGELLELAWELNDLGFDSVVRLSPDRRPSVEIFLPSGRPRATTAQRGRTSVFTWEQTSARADRDRFEGGRRVRSRMRMAAERLLEVAR